MSISPHYYVLSLSPEMNLLFEAFRDLLIQVENQGFPVVGPSLVSDSEDQEQRRAVARSVDHCFGGYYLREPLKLIVVGDQSTLSAFNSVTTHETAIIGRVEGDHAATCARDLGRIVWPIVKAAMSGVQDRAMQDLETAARCGTFASGLEAVVRASGRDQRSTLMVEDDYHFRGSIMESDGALVLSPEVDVREALDDAVDAVIERVLVSGGNVLFTPNGALRDRGRVVLLFGDPDQN